MEKPSQFVAVVGNLEFGYSIHGPFADVEAAQKWIDAQQFDFLNPLVMELIDGAEDYFLPATEESDADESDHDSDTLEDDYFEANDI
ncbi:hypothetical protein EBZ39_02280 [bacterium]|nr:hypothetical protein [bacterium]